MKWNELFNENQRPSAEDIKFFLSEAAPVWDELTSYLENSYQVKPQMAFSKCSAQPGWNIKYKKWGKSLCTLYPMPDYFIALVVVGAKEEEEVGIAAEAGMFTPYVQELYHRTVFSAGGRWMMIEVKDPSVTDDIKALISIRVKPKR